MTAFGIYVLCPELCMVMFIPPPKFADARWVYTHCLVFWLAHCVLLMSVVGIHVRILCTIYVIV